MYNDYVPVDYDVFVSITAPPLPQDTLASHQDNETTIEFRSKIQKLNYNYFIDLVNEPIKLKSQYLVQTGYQIT